VSEAMTALDAERKPAEAPKAEAAKPTGT
jgi:hypothetical protein